MKAMKRWMGALLALIVVIGICPAGWAAGEPYVFEEWDMEVTVPEGDYYILLRDIDPDSQALADMGFTVEQVNELLAGEDIYLDAVYFDGSYELAVIVIAGEDFEAVFDYGLFSKFQRNVTSAAVKREWERLGYQVTEDVSWYEGEEAAFAVFGLVPPDENGWIYRYQTIYNGRLIIVTASSIYLDAPTDEIKEQARLLAEGIHFTRKLPVPEEVLESYKEDEEEPSMLMDILKSALIGAVVGGGGYVLFDLLRKKRGKKTGSESEKPTGGDAP